MASKLVVVVDLEDLLLGKGSDRVSTKTNNSAEIKSATNRATKWRLLANGCGEAGSEWAFFANLVLSSSISSDLKSKESETQNQCLPHLTIRRNKEYHSFLDQMGPQAKVSIHPQWRKNARHFQHPCETTTEQNNVSQSSVIKQVSCPVARGVCRRQNMTKVRIVLWGRRERA
jgi:hypothetical protein